MQWITCAAVLQITQLSSHTRATHHARRQLEALTTCLQSCVTTGNAKVQWMACAAAHALFTNAQLQALPQARQPTTSLLLLLTMLVRDSANFKVRGLCFWFFGWPAWERR